MSLRMRKPTRSSNYGVANGRAPVPGRPAECSKAMLRTRMVVVDAANTTTSRLARDTGRLVRLRWPLPNASTVWKLPERDASLRCSSGTSVRVRAILG